MAAPGEKGILRGLNLPCFSLLSNTHCRTTSATFHFFAMLVEATPTTSKRPSWIRRGLMGVAGDRQGWARCALQLLGCGVAGREAHEVRAVLCEGRRELSASVGHQVLEVGPLRWNEARGTDLEALKRAHQVSCEGKLREAHEHMRSENRVCASLNGSRTSSRRQGRAQDKLQEAGQSAAPAVQLPCRP